MGRLCFYNQGRWRTVRSAVLLSWLFVCAAELCGARSPVTLAGRILDPQGNPLIGDGFVGVSVPEFRGALLRPFYDGRMTLSTEFLIASGSTGQTTEVFAFPGDRTYPTRIERIVGVPLKSYVTAAWAYHFAK